MRELEIQTAAVFEPLLAPRTYKGAYGGRGSGKSHFFAGLMVEHALSQPGFRGVCVREVQKSIQQSAKRLIEDKITEFGLASAFDCQASQTVTPGGGVIVYQGMQDHTAESIKSLEGFDVAWVEEAQSLTAYSWTLLRPTIRKHGAEIWCSWNPRRKNDPVDAYFRQGSPTDAICVRANWSDNPWLPPKLNQDRLDDLRDRPDQYDHIWEGGYATVTEGAYYAQHIAEAKADGRIGHVSADPLMTLRAIWDIGGTGAKADACAIWIVQFIGRELRFVDYHEAQGQPLAAHVQWLRSRGYERALCVLPHDGASNDKVYDVSYESALRQAGFEVVVVPNQGKGAAMQRVEAARRLFPNIWIDARRCSAGIDAIGAYHERRDEARGIGLGPEHDWASHGADAFGLACVVYEAPQTSRGPLKRHIRGIV